MKQVFYPKGGDPVGASGARVSAEGWDDRYEFDGTKLKQFPLPAGRPLARSTRLDGLAQELSALLPERVLAEQGASRQALAEAKERAASIQAEMVAVQEELDWEVYRLYGLVDEELTTPVDALPSLQKGQRAFEIALARRVADGQATTSWFERHASTPMTDLPEDWDPAYRKIVERRLELIEHDRAINLLERPEYKRRWHWPDWSQLEQEALRAWLCDRLEAPELWANPVLQTTARLASRLRADEAFVTAAGLYTGQVDVDLEALVAELVADEAVPFFKGYRLKPSGLRKRAEWENTWELQRREDALDARTSLAADDPDFLSEEDASTVKKEQVGEIPVPPKYTTGDFTSGTVWRLRGKLDVPKERFISYPGTRAGADSSMVIGWAGWDHLTQAQALAAHLAARRDDGAEVPELTGLLAGLHELTPWLKQWHNDYDPGTGERPGEFFDAFVDTQAQRLGLTRDDLDAWTPPATRRQRRARAAS